MGGMTETPTEKLIIADVGLVLTLQRVEATSGK